MVSIFLLWVSLSFFYLLTVWTQIIKQETETGASFRCSAYTAKLPDQNPQQRNKTSATMQVFVQLSISSVYQYTFSFWGRDRMQGSWQVHYGLKGNMQWSGLGNGNGRPCRVWIGQRVGSRWWWGGVRGGAEFSVCTDLQVLISCTIYWETWWVDGDWTERESGRGVRSKNLWRPQNKTGQWHHHF